MLELEKVLEMALGWLIFVWDCSCLQHEKPIRAYDFDIILTQCVLNSTDSE